MPSSSITRDNSIVAIYVFGEKGIEPVSYRDSKPYQMTSRFLKNTEAMLEKLLSD